MTVSELHSGGLCFARRHLGAAVSAFHAYARAVSQESGVFYSDARRDAWDFGVSKNTITSWTRRLEKEGWFRQLDESPRRKRNKVTGMYDSIRYEVLDHDTWAVLYPGRCRFREPSNQSPKLGQAPVPTTESRLSVFDSAGPNWRVPPVPETGTKQELSRKREQESKQERGGNLSPLEFKPFSPSPESNGNTRFQTTTCPDCGGLLHPWAVEEGLAHDCPASRANLA